jgi:hypothetical protein
VSGGNIYIINSRYYPSTCLKDWEKPTKKLNLCILLAQLQYEFVTFQTQASHTTSGVPRNFVRGGGGCSNKFGWGQRERGSGGFRSICKWVKPVFWLGCYRCIFYGTANLAQLCQNFRISGGGLTPKPFPLSMPLSSGGIHCVCTEIGMCFTFRLTGSWPGQDGHGQMLINLNI